MCRLATVNPQGVPHVSPLWFVWDGDLAWMYSIVKSQRWVNIGHNPQCALVVDDGDGYGELRGVELTGTVEPIGEIPRTGAPNKTLLIPEQLFGLKYEWETMNHDGRHAWLRLIPEKIVSWDFTKLSVPK